MDGELEETDGHGGPCVHEYEELWVGVDQHGIRRGR